MDSGPPFLCVNTNQWRLAGTRQPMGGYFAVSTLLFYFSCDLHQSKKVRTRRRGILGMNMNTEIMWIDFIILLRLSAFCRQAFFVVFLGFVSAVDHLLYLSLATQWWNRRCSAWILPKDFFKNFSARLPKRMMQTVLVAKGEENRITRLCGREGRWIHERAHIILGASMRNTQSWRHSIQGKRSETQQQST